MLRTQTVEATRLGHEVFSVFDTTYADLLVDLAIERGFEGWLVNVEVPLGMANDVGIPQHVKSLLQWMEYLTAETRRRIPGGETQWYDGVNTEGKVRWQNQLTPLNLPFFSTCDSIFLNYFWDRLDPELGGKIVDELRPKRKRNEVYFGLDVWGRGQYGGGGFESWRALDCVTGASRSYPPLPEEEQSTRLYPFNLSVALFAPAWTVESSNLNHTLSDRAGYERWWADEQYLWTGGLETPNVVSERKRMEKERKERRGVRRAHDLALALKPGSTFDALDPFDYNTVLPPLPGSFSPLNSFGRSPRYRPSPAGIFYTNFSNGAGHRFFLEGARVMDSTKGWSEVDFTFPSPSLFYSTRAAGVEVQMDEDDGWMGSGALKVILRDTAESPIVPLCPLRLHVEDGFPLMATIIWKATLETTQLSVEVGGDASALNTYESVTSSIINDWKSTTTWIYPPPADQFRISSIGISLSSSLTSESLSVLVGSISITPSYRYQLPQPIVTDLIFDRASRMVRWGTARLVGGPGPSSIPLEDRPDLRAPAMWPTFLLYTLWWRGEDKEGGQEAVFLGTSQGTEFFVGNLEKGQVICRGVRDNGVLVDWERCPSVAV